MAAKKAKKAAEKTDGTFHGFRAPAGQQGYRDQHGTFQQGFRDGQNQYHPISGTKSGGGGQTQIGKLEKKAKKRGK